jgi:hypothetical protein
VENGFYSEENTNVKEADKIIELLHNLLLNNENKDEIGVLTFNQSQKNLIEQK